MASPREVRETNEQEALIALLDDDIAAKVRSGEFVVSPGRKPDRPWVRRADNHRIVQGQSPRTPDPAETGKRTAFKQTASHREALELFLPMFSEGPQRQSFERLVERVVDAVEGVPVKVMAKCGHDGCDLTHAMVYVPKVDTSVGFKLIELLAGKAAQTIQQTKKVEGDIRILEHRTAEVVVYDMSTQTAEQRRQRLIDAGVIEADWIGRVLPAGGGDGEVE